MAVRRAAPAPFPQRPFSAVAYGSCSSPLLADCAAVRSSWFSKLAIGPGTEAHSATLDDVWGVAFAGRTVAHPDGS